MDETIYSGRTFTKYALLGDDIVIADEKAALIRTPLTTH
ncbi:hypothetical protein CCACVL1_08303 [Corchorus capsularis]|uniref:Uncharacterized protein n=1 Tax=Corchorus capsularis TaxID=210143 RepID=A0A1R3J176_COCAP|nr:hypothetical protein CCACVL1_08303 [Corchorus capsularis]